MLTQGQKETLTKASHDCVGVTIRFILYQLQDKVKLVLTKGQTPQRCIKLTE